MISLVMLPQVKVQESFVCEGTRANFTFEGLLAGVTSHMNLESA
jgi:hypothetical protein